jgi:hypothetical protein
VSVAERTTRVRFPVAASVAWAVSVAERTTRVRFPVAASVARAVSVAVLVRTMSDHWA